MDTNDKFPNQLEIIGLVLAGLPFICNFTTSSSTTVNGRVVEESSTNYVALILGPLAILAGLAIFPILARVDQSTRMKHLAVMVVIIVGGAIQVARGVGAI